jgi:hypothetical protein
MEFRKVSLGGISYGTDMRMKGPAKVENVDFVDHEFFNSIGEPVIQDFLLH